MAAPGLSMKGVVASLPILSFASAASARPTECLSPASRTAPTPLWRIFGQRLRARASMTSTVDSLRYRSRSAKQTGAPSRNRCACASIRHGSSVTFDSVASGVRWPSCRCSRLGPCPTKRMDVASNTTSAFRSGLSDNPSMTCPTRSHTGRSVERRARSSSDTRVSGCKVAPCATKVLQKEHVILHGGPKRQRRAAPFERREAALTLCLAVLAPLVIVMVFEHLDDFRRLPEARLLLRLAVLRTTGFERGFDATDELVVAVEQVQVLLGIAEHEIEPRFHRERQVRALDALAHLPRHAEGKVRQSDRQVYAGEDRKSRRVGKECRSRWSPYH